eukprot:5952367-Lingulodinium_polyedra.AAC.1
MRASPAALRALADDWRAESVARRLLEQEGALMADGEVDLEESQIEPGAGREPPEYWATGTEAAPCEPPEAAGPLGARRPAATAGPRGSAFAARLEAPFGVPAKAARTEPVT